MNAQVITGNASQLGILVDGASGVTSKNGGAARGLAFGVELVNATDCTIDNVAATTVSDCIIEISGRGNRIVNCNLSLVNPHVARGILLDFCTGDLVDRNLIRACKWGVVSAGGGGNCIRAITGPRGLFLSPNDSYEENIFAGNPAVTVAAGVHSTD